MKYNKLVRDKIPEIMRAKGLQPRFHKAKNDEYTNKLNRKLQEEVQEFIESGSVEEVADILEVIDAICKDRNFDIKTLKKIKQDKKRMRGGFSKKIILDKG